MKELLRFEYCPSEGKTYIVNVYSTHSAELLGTIHWRSGWRHYVISYENNIDMSLSCNIELNNFMQKLEDERLKNLGKNNGRN
mgnify:CR=1 FL=1